MERPIEKLNLTEEQENKISDLRTNHQKKMTDYKAELEKAKIDMRDIRNSSGVSRNNLISAVEKMNDVKNKMAVERINHHMDVYELLNDEQKEIWREQKPSRDHQGFGFRNKSNGKRFNCF
ncbi:MAG: hypothetical protein EHM47_13100 [Ignavibacteriales bacterium]|nr:MAG: hypothetical protein EHM47_13100 [Ignavibacteriales bacterium]